MSDERWREVPNFPDYEVSDEGRVRSWRSGNGRGRRRETPFILRSGGSGGYAKVSLCCDDKVKRQGVHRIVLRAFIGEPPAGQEGCHNNGDLTDNRLSNLRWDTRLGNLADDVRNGTRLRGASHGLSILNESQVLEIRARRETYAIIAKSYGISVSTVSSIKHRRTWVWL